MAIAIDFKALGAKAASEGKDMTVAQQGGGGGDYEPPAAGPVRLRFVAYIEVGKQEYKFENVVSYKPTAYLVFELSGAKHPPKVLEDGTKLPHRITLDMPVSLNEKANFFKLFQRMNYEGKAQHIIQLLGEAYRGEVVHTKYAKTGEDKSKPESWTGVRVGLKGKDGLTIQAPRYQDPETDEWKRLPVEPAITELKGFLWDYADKAMWDSIYIDGNYPDRKDKDGNVISKGGSKNKFQDLIKGANNFKGSPIEEVLLAAGAKIDLPEAEKPVAKADVAPATKPSEDDVLNGII